MGSRGGDGVDALARRCWSLGNGAAQLGWQLFGRRPVVIRTLVTLTAPLRSPLRARGARKQDLASIIGKLDRSRRRNRDQGRGVGMEFDLGGRERRKGSAGEIMSLEKIQRFRNGPTLIGSGHVSGTLAATRWPAFAGAPVAAQLLLFVVALGFAEK